MTAQKPLIIDGGTIKDLPTGDQLDLGAFALPSTDGTANQVLQTNGSGTVSWATVSGGGGSPASPTNSVQFNNAGSFGGSSSLTWNGSTLAVDGAVDRATSGTLTLGGTTASAITIGKTGVTTTFPGPVNLNGTVTSVSQTTFTTDAVFQGNVTFGDAAADNISFVGQVDTAITQEGIAAPALSPASTGRIYFDSTSNTFKVSQNGGAYANLVTGGTVTSISLAAGSTGLTFSTDGGATFGSPKTITSSGTFTFGGTLAVGSGGTGTTTVPTNGQLLIGNGTGYTVAGLTAGSGVTITPGAGTITISATGSGGTVTGTGTATQLAYFTGASAIGSETAVGTDALTWDATNNRLGVGTSAPTGTLQVAGGTAAAGIAGTPITLTAQSGGTGNTNGGNVLFVAGASAGTGTAGSVIARPGTNSATAFQVQNAAGTTTVLDVDTTNVRVGINTSAPSGMFHVAGGTAGAGLNGAQILLTAQGGGSGTPNGGDVNLNGGAAGSTGGTAGSINLTAGAGGVGNGGSVVIKSGSATGTAGKVVLQTLTNSTTGVVVLDSSSATLSVFDTTNTRFGVGTTPSGPLHVSTGAAAAGVAGGPITLTAQTGGTGNTNGGDVNITAGGSVGTGTPGKVILKPGVNSTTAVQIQLSGGQVLLNADTTNGRIGINNSGTPLAVLDVASGQAAFADGVVSAPALAFRDNLNTGIYSAATNQVCVTTGGAQRMVVADDGVGIGTTAGLGAGGPLVVVGGTAATGVAGNSISLTAQSGGTGTTNGGSVNITAGASGTTGGTAGNITLTAGTSSAGTAGSIVAKSGTNSTTAFSVQTSTGTSLIGVDTTNSRVGVGGVVGASLTHTFNVGSAGASNFAIASGGRIHTYDGTAPTNGQVLIGNTALGNFAKAALTAGTGIAITNGAGSITIAASNAGGVQPITTISTTTTLDGTYYTVLCSATLTVNLPAAASNTGRIYNIKNTGAAATITIDPNAAETIDGAATYTLTTQYQAVTIQCDGSSWFIIAVK